MRYLQTLLASLCVAAPTIAAAATPYEKTVAECKALFTPLIAAAQVQFLIPDRTLKDELEISGNRDECTVEFRETGWDATKVESGTRLLAYSVSHGAHEERRFEGLKEASVALGGSYKMIDTSGFDGVRRAFISTDFGRHWLYLYTGRNVISVEIRDRYDKSALIGFAKLVLQAAAKPELKEWMERRPDQY